jgi:hypothetical protein
MNREPGFPCDYCGVRADVDCRHRKGIEPRAPMAEKVDKRRAPGTYHGNGLNFRIGKNNALAFQVQKKAGRPKLPKGRG